jgi:hypothetical protein
MAGSYSVQMCRTKIGGRRRYSGQPVRNPAYESSKTARIALGRAIARAGEENWHSPRCDRAGFHGYADGL